MPAQVNINININVQNSLNPQKDPKIGIVEQAPSVLSKGEEKDQVHSINNQDSSLDDLKNISQSDIQVQDLVDMFSRNNPAMQQINPNFFTGSNHSTPYIRSYQTQIDEESKAHKHWLKIRNVFKSIKLMRVNIVKPLQNPEDIITDINNSPRRKRTSILSWSSLNLTKCALDDVRKIDRFFELIQEGGDKNIQKLLEELENDPKKHIYDRKNPNHLINRPNRLEQTPVYVACRNGNLSIVKFLLEQEADPHLKSSVSRKEQESIL